MIKVMIVEDQLLMLELLEQMLLDSDDIEVVARAADGFEAIEQASRHKPDLVLMDLRLPGCDGIEATKIIKEKHPAIKVLVLTTSEEDSDIYGAIKNGADGYLLKTVSKKELVLSIQGVHQDLEIIQGTLRNRFYQAEAASAAATGGGKQLNIDGVNVTLTRREMEVIGLIVESKSTAEMAAALFLSEGRVRNIITEILSKLQVKDRAQLAVFALKNNLV